MTLGGLFSEIYSFESCLFDFRYVKNYCQIMFLMTIFNTRVSGDTKFMGTIESDSLRCLIWHLGKSNLLFLH